MARIALVRMTFYRGLCHREIARETGILLGTVETRIELGIKKLRAAASAFGSRDEWLFGTGSWVGLRDPSIGERQSTESAAAGQKKAEKHLLISSAPPMSDLRTISIRRSHSKRCVAQVVINNGGLERPLRTWLPNSGYEINRTDENLPSSGRSYHCHCRQSDEPDSLELNGDGVLRE